MQRKTMLMTALGLGALILGKMILNSRRGRGHDQTWEKDVDAMAEDSFPASDAPSFTPVA